MNKVSNLLRRSEHANFVPVCETFYEFGIFFQDEVNEGIDRRIGSLVVFQQI